MPQLSEEHIEYAKYKWEFLRRNPNYIADWEELQRVFDEKYDGNEGPAMPDPDVKGRTIVETSREEIEFCVKWRVASPLPPDISYDEFAGFSVDGMFDVNRLMENWTNLKELMASPVALENGWAYEHDGEMTHRSVSHSVAETGELSVKVNLNFSKARILSEFEALIDEWRELYGESSKKLILDKFLRDRNIKKLPLEEGLEDEFGSYLESQLKDRQKLFRHKYHFDNFDIYLQVYDLRKDGLSWSKIYEQLDLNSLQSARNHYRKAVDLIEKGVNWYVKLP